MDDALLARLLAPEFLTHQISRHTQLGDARLQSAAPRAIDAPGYLSDLIGVTLAWSADTGAPMQAVLKVSHANFGAAELPFYRDVAVSLHCPAIPRFFAGGTDAPTGRTWLLMEDLSSTHESPSEEPIPPTFSRCKRLVEALAQFHVAGSVWADASHQGPTLNERLLKSDWLQPQAERLFAQVGDALGPGTRALYADFLAALPSLIERVGRVPATLVHGDAHVWNAMLPREGKDVVAKLIDWDGWHVGIGAWDLAYMMAVHWDRDVRQRFELKLLDCYHHALVAGGVKDYSRDALHDDYRLAVLLHLRTPISRYAMKMSPFVWWPQLARIQQAVEDLRCHDLIK